MQPYELILSPGENALQNAIDQLPADETIPCSLLLTPGVYLGKTALHRGNVTIASTTNNPEDVVISWHDGAFTLLEDGMKRGTFRSYTFFVDGAHITLRGLTIENTAAPREAVGQAIALYADGDLFLCENCVLRSHQDTLFTAPLPPKEFEKNGFIGPKQFAPRTPQRHTYRNCRISGDIDFIFGGAAAWFENCEIIADDGRHNTAQGEYGYCTAASTPERQQFGYVFHHCRFTTVNCPPNSILLARPWREYAKTVFLHCEYGPHIKPEGFDDWGKPTFHQNGLFAEYGCFSLGDAPARVPYARSFTSEEAAAYTYDAFLDTL